MTNDAAVAWMRKHIFYRGVDGRTEGERVVSELKVYENDEPLYSATTVAELRAEVERRKSAQAALSQYASAAEQRADAAERRVAECLKFIAGVRDELHNRRTADWYPEGAHNAAEQMSEDMRLIGNTCADFDPYAEKESP